MEPALPSSPLLGIDDYRYPGGWAASSHPAERAFACCRALEEGRILIFAAVPFELPADDRAFLISQRQTESRFHKNISYRPRQDVMRGTSSESREDTERLHGILRRYSAEVTRFLEDFLRPYAGKLALDFASFRPLEEAGRDLPLHKRNDLLHVDAFPTRPTRGARILRVFTNIHPQAPRVWRCAEPFHHLAPRLAIQAGLRRFAARGAAPWRPLARNARAVARAVGIPAPDRSAYDEFMLRFHDWLKENSAFQEGAPREPVEFPPGATWLVYTDGVPHAALSGQYALEQTYIVPREALVWPQVAPISVLEELAGCEMGR
ncbi:MAG TPA: Kdo hydroxylase family protein [Terriglobales bacterium]|nr:Kdo hydroxylase family protein [Terriglobales bacterium]